MRIALVHYSAPPVIGGVERVLEQQARVLLANGHEVMVVCGNEGAVVEGAEVRVVKGLRANGRRDAGGSWRGEMASALAGCEVVIVHNMFTMPFNEEAARGLAELGGACRVINWVHDVDVSRDWFESLALRARHVAVSEVRRRLLQELLGLEAVAVVPNGVAVAATLGWTERMAAWVEKHGLLERKAVLFHPARVLARKNMELGIEVLRALRARGVDAVYVVSGAPDPHRASSAGYGDRLRRRVAELGLGEAVVFMADEGAADEAEVRAMYQVADLVFFPSWSEGFGLPLLEAVLHRTPVLCSDIPVHREVGGDGVEYFFLEDSPQKVAAAVRRMLGKDRLGKARRQVLAARGWQRVYEVYVEPLLKES